MNPTQQTSGHRRVPTYNVMRVFHLLTLAISGAFTLYAFAGPSVQAESQTTISAVSQAESATLADACRLTKLINDERWDEIEKALGTKEGMITYIRQQATLKDWAGIGAYRGTTVDEKSPLRITHQFGFAPRSSPHGILLTYIITETGPSKPSLMILGW